MRCLLGASSGPVVPQNSEKYGKRMIDLWDLESDYYLHSYLKDDDLYVPWHTGARWCSAEAAGGSNGGIRLQGRGYGRLIASFLVLGLALSMDLGSSCDKGASTAAWV